MAGPSNCGAESVDVAPHIFLSHSGRQKNFVENLYNALRSANQTVFFDTHTLPKGSSFPHKIKQAARGCKLGVVVVSDDFFSSKWPMIELEILLLERGEDPKVLPLFYKLRPSDLKSSENLERWQATWKEAARDANRWEDAVRKLRSINGEQFIQGMSETAYIKKVVQRICKLVPCPVPYDMSLIQGHQRLAKVIARMFEDVEASQDSEGKACIVGLHGVGGLGKTTLSKCMVNFYTSEYLGRSCLVEFPTDGDKLRVAQECRKALEILTILSDEHVSKRANSFDQIQELALDGLIQIVEDRFGIEVHDLYMELGRSEAKNSPIFYITDSTRSVEDVVWEKLKKVFLSKDSYGDVDACVFDKLQQQKCGSLEVLHVDDIETSSGFCLDSMPSLRMLVLKKVQSAASGIDLKLNGVVQLRTLRIVECHSIKRVTGLDALQSLHTLHLEGCSCLVDLDGLSGSIFLETLTVKSCESLQKIPDLSTLTCLEKLHLLNNKALKEVESFSSTLIDVYIENCKCLKRLPNVEGLTKLKRMELRHNEALEEVVGKSFSTITAVSRYGCNNLTRLPKSTNFDIIDSLALKISQLTNAVIHKHTRHQI